MKKHFYIESFIFLKSEEKKKIRKEIIIKIIE